MAKPKFTNTELTRSASGAKRTFLRKAKNGEYLDVKLSKADALNRIASSLKVTSRTLYSGDRKIYLDNWYDTLIKEIQEVNEQQVQQESLSSVEELTNKTIKELREENKELKALLNAYKQKVENYQIKVDELMTRDIKKYERI